MRIAFMGTPDFAVPALEALAARHEIAAVYTQPPRPAGRGGRPRPTPVAQRAAALGIAVRTPANFREAAERAAFAALGLDAAVVVAYGLLLPEAVLDAPRHGCFNLHASLLPRWRGAAPIQRAIIAGDSETGVCVMRMEKGLDTGPVALTARTPIRADDTAGALHDRLSALGAPLMVEALELLGAGRLQLTPQPAEGVYAPKIDKREAGIDWRRPATEVDRLIRGLSPFPGAWFILGGERVKVLMSELAPGAGAPGAVLDDRLAIACGSGAVRLTRLQRAGAGPLDARDFLRGRPVPAGVELESKS
ncbi:methionyl-tRNA formyltransferase [Pikeienuella piscinae]|uniref:Methionyl-tRNA formyltransferase n=1 Tax=Pikeienuella piscinae TaxID=2748098 RepID=A0A7L5C543_9RHOB|nr:methionyl-tRNA formyltransferase [Pikeienuella piscinae]QIE57089.1 methionyl-tRNA formyltransferase [Pikeienuella piscinae]